MAGEWEETSLAAVMDVKHGFAFPGENIRDEPPGDILLTPGNFAIGGGFKGDKFKYFDGEVPADYVLNEGDLIVTMTDLSKQADTLGYPALVP
jgi:type I restriction enzyme S subunit